MSRLAVVMLGVLVLAGCAPDSSGDAGHPGGAMTGRVRAWWHRVLGHNVVEDGSWRWCLYCRREWFT